MPYLQELRASTTQNPEQLLIIWRQQRAFRVGKALCYAGLILSALATIADSFWSPLPVILTDVLLFLGCALSLYWIRKSSRPLYYWWPLFLSFWISALPSFWITGGINSPFFGVGLASLYVMGVVMDSQNKSMTYLIFSFLHIPIFLAIEFFHPLSANPSLPILFTSIITTLVISVVYVCVQAILKMERELSLEFANHYHSLAKTQNQLREAQSLAHVGSWEWDIRADLISWSDELFKIFDVPKEKFDPSFNGYLQRLHPDIRDKVHKIIQKSIETGEDFVFENSVDTSTGRKMIFSRGRVIKDSEGRIQKMLGTSQDITDRKQIESQLTDARNELEKRVEERTLQLAQSLDREKSAKEIAENASQAKMQFLANMSHEIRTPMNSILGFSELLSSGDHSEEEAKDYLGRIRTNGKQLLHLIDDILDLSKFEAGRIPIQKTAFSLKLLIDDVVNSFLPTLKSKGLDLHMSFNGELTPQIFTDTDRVRQVLTNLLSNAIKFSEHGSVQVRTTCQPSDDKTKVNLTIDVEDSGIGISLENQKNLFQPFKQGDSSVARKFGGTGLGLALSKRIAEALGGKLELKRSAPGTGSLFSFQIPVDRVLKETSDYIDPSLAKKDIEYKKLHNKRILLVEDSPDNAMLISHYVKSIGAQVDMASDGLQAVQSASQHSYDCILMDIQMPGMDGLEATRRIRENGFRNPIIALTAHALPAEAERSLKAGCDLHLTKPISRNDLLQSLSSQMNI